MFQTFWLVIAGKLMRIWIQLITLMRIWIQLITLMRILIRIQVTKMIWIRIHNTAVISVVWISIAGWLVVTLRALPVHVKLSCVFLWLVSL
jgi:hypothetical protein